MPVPEIRRPGDSWRQALADLPLETSPSLALSFSDPVLSVTETPMLEASFSSGDGTRLRAIRGYLLPLAGGVLLLSGMLAVALFG